MKTIAWAFLADDRVGKYFIESDSGEETIYLKEPKPRKHPFSYSVDNKWKPTKIIIELYEN